MVVHLWLGGAGVGTSVVVGNAGAVNADNKGIE